MKTFRVKASEQVFYQEDIDAKNEEEAIEKFYELMQDGGLEPCDSDNFTIDQVEN
jgi:hypothetical protein